MKWLSRLLSPRADFTDAQRVRWDTQGYLVLAGAIPDAAIARYLAAVDRLWAERQRADNPLVIDFWEGPLCGRRMYFRDAPDDSRRFSHKLNDTHLVVPECRDLMLRENLLPAMRALLGGEPLAIGSLTFEKGSQQEDHFDTYYMPPPGEGRMIVSSICLEDIHPDAGPVQVYPGSHLIPPFRFSHGGVHVVDQAEKKDAKAYIDAELTRRGIRPEPFLGRRGDVLFWHGQLYHGGVPIRDHARTRRTLVTHYWRTGDVEPGRVLPHGPGRSYLKRDHHAPWA
jgi:ectoine hydroxylase-related dioxygenase (phytanoyl-CoA dioxygenase family)